MPSLQISNRPFCALLFAGLVLAPPAASAQVSCGDTIGPGQWAFMTGNLNCTAANTDGECALYVRGPNAFLHGMGHRLRCTTAGGSGVCVLGTGARVESLTVRGCEEGFEVEGGGGHYLEDVHARASDQDGIAVDSNDNTIRNSSSKNNGENGVVSSGRRNWFDRVTSNDNADAGFLLEDDSDGAARENDITSAVAKRNRLGLSIGEGARDNDIRNSLFKNNDEEGAEVYGDRNRFTQVRFVGNLVWGMWLLDTAEENEISRSELSRNGVHGLRIDGDRNRFDDNDIADNGIHGVTILSMGEDNVGTGNHVTGNGVHGLFVSGDRNRLLSNHIADSDTDGVSVQGAENQVQDNVITDSGVDGVGLGPTSMDNIVTGNLISGSGGLPINDQGTGNVTAPNP